MTIYFFTGTGNSLDISKRLAARFDAKIQSIPQVKTDEVKSDDAIGVVFPVYAYNMPAIVTRFLTSVSLTAEYTFAVVAHGGGPGSIGDVISNTVKFDNVYTVKTWSNYLPFNRDEPPVAVDVTDELSHIMDSIDARKTTAYTSGGQQPFDIAPWAGQALDYQRRGDCLLCGVCVRVCPVANSKITYSTASDASVSEKSIIFYDHCEGCMACMQNCPTAALHLPNEPTKYRYRNPHITTEEIIAANEQSAV